MNEQILKKARIILFLLIFGIIIGLGFIISKLTDFAVIPAILAAMSLIAVSIGFVTSLAADSLLQTLKRCDATVLAQIDISDLLNPALNYEFKNVKYKISASNIKQPSPEKMRDALEKGMLIHINSDNPEEICNIEESDIEKLCTKSKIFVIIGITAAAAAAAIHIAA